jgi:hypothetical protein
MRARFILPALALASTPAAAQFLLVPEITNDRVALFSAVDGSLINANYIDLVPAGASLPIEALVVGNEIWVSDQNADRIMRFSLDGTTWLGNVAGGIDNIRGMELVNGEVWVTNAGTANGAPGQAIVRFSTTGMNLGSFPVGNPFDAVNFQGDVLIGDITAQDIVRYNPAGALVNVFHASDGVTGIDFPEQISVRANGNVLAAGFSPPMGYYEYDPQGVQINFWARTTNARGVHELTNGNFLVSEGSTVAVFDPTTNTAITVLGAGGRYVTPFAGASPPGTPFCFGDGSGTACPCGNNSPVGAGAGCLTSFGVGGKLAVTGNPSLASDTLVLAGSQMPDAPSLYFQGTQQMNGGLGAMFGDGLRCAGGMVVRLKQITNAGGASQYPQAGDPPVSVRGLVAAPGIRTYQIWFRNNAPFCTPDGWNLTNGVEVNWAL